jgi:ABC-type multidrug transport system fused ATPase/permease subunit
MLSSAQRQLVEIMRALKSGVRVLALDEPTSSLTDEEVERLGLALLRLSERMNELKRLFNLDDEDLEIDLGPLGRLR